MTPSASPDASSPPTSTPSTPQPGKEMRRVRVYPSQALFRIGSGGTDIAFTDIRTGMLFTLKDPPETPLAQVTEDGTELYLALSDAEWAPGADPSTAEVQSDTVCTWVEARRTSPIRIYRYDTVEAWAAAEPGKGGHSVRGEDLRHHDLFAVIDPLHARHGTEEGTDDGNTLRRWGGEGGQTYLARRTLAPSVLAMPSVIVAQRSPPG